MRKYTNDTGVPPPRMFNRMFLSPQNQQVIADQVLSTCNQVFSTGNISSSLNEIKTLLESGLLAPNLHPQDNFPKIVKAIANKTAGMEGWEFSPAAMDKLNQIEGVTNSSLQI